MGHVGRGSSGLDAAAWELPSVATRQGPSLLTAASTQPASPTQEPPAPGHEPCPPGLSSVQGRQEGPLGGTDGGGDAGKALPAGELRRHQQRPDGRLPRLSTAGRS